MITSININIAGSMVALVLTLLHARPLIAQQSLIDVGISPSCVQAEPANPAAESPRRPEPEVKHPASRGSWLQSVLRMIGMGAGDPTGDRSARSDATSSTGRASRPHEFMGPGETIKVPVKPRATGHESASSSDSGLSQQAIEFSILYGAVIGRIASDGGILGPDGTPTGMSVDLSTGRITAGSSLEVGTVLGQELFLFDHGAWKLAGTISKSGRIHQR